MANEQYAFLKTSNVPTRDGLQQAIGRAGFDLKLDADYHPRTNVGFVPCALNGKDTGVEMYFDDSKELLDSFRKIAGDRECCISFRWGGDIWECACALVVSYALAASFDAIVSYEGEAPPESLEAFRKETEHAIALAAEADNQTLQRTVAAEKRSWIQRLFRRGPGRWR